MNNILKQIIEKKREKVKISKNLFTENALLENIKNVKNFSDFKSKIKKRDSQKKISIIAEIKRASPSAGEIIKKYDPLNIAKIYIENGASCLSVLSEEDFFLGKLDHIKVIKDNYDIPILCKDFFIDTYQVSLAKSFGADCILIILSAVDKVLANDLYQAANDLNMSSLVEVHSKNEAENALFFENSLIGINNRDLETLDISLNTTVKLSEILRTHKNPLISESGINSTKDIKFIIKNTKINNFLIGESLLKSADIGQKLHRLTQITL
jgi:indole-3-glycerol phosphate synthase